MPFKLWKFPRIWPQKAQVHQGLNEDQPIGQENALPLDAEELKSSELEEVQPSGLEYESLKDKEIRLLRFKWEETPSGPFELQLQHREIHAAPFYIALSYVWGDPNKTKPIRIDSREVSVTENLFNALLHIYELLTTFEEAFYRDSGNDIAVFFWIDAICINQQDMDEKSRQISMMQEIYSTAYTVLIWLGTLEDCGVDPNVTSILLAFAELNSPPIDFRRRMVGIWPRDEDLNPTVAVELLGFYKNLLHSDWFRRQWVLQEYTLSQREPCALLGPNLFSFRSLYDLGSKILQHVKKDSEDSDWFKFMGKSFASSQIFAFGPSYLQDWISSSEFRDKSLAAQIHTLTRLASTRASTVPHDKIYALLGLVDLTKLPDRLVPDYRQPYGQVCREWTRFLIENTKNLDVLEFNLPYELEEQPSWVMDFRFNHWAERELSTPHSGLFSSDGQSLLVDGVKCGAIKLYYFTSHRDNAGERLEEFYNTVLVSAANIRKQPIGDVWKEWLSNFSKRTQFFSPDDIGSQYQSATEFINAAVSSNGSRPNYASKVLNSFNERNFALADDGQVTWGHWRRQNESTGEQQIWALRGASAYSIVNKVAPHRYRYVGRFHLHHEAGVTFDEAFFRPERVKRIALV